MALDQTTEIVSHFIGLFEIGTEEARLKEAYAAFRALQAEAADLGNILTISVPFKAPYNLGTFMPNGSYIPEFWPLAGSLLAGSIAAPILATGASMAELFALPNPTSPVAAALNPPPIPYGATGPAGSVVSITYQANTLNDGDTITVEGAAPLQNLADDSNAIPEAVALAKSFAVVPLVAPIAAEGLGPDMALTVFEAIQTASIPDFYGIKATLLTSDDATGRIMVNGSEVEALPTVEDILPAALQSESADAASDDESDTPDATPTAEQAVQIEEVTALIAALTDDDDEDTDDIEDREDSGSTFTLSDPPDTQPSAEDDGNLEGVLHVASGSNQLVNEAAIVNAWLDAPVITVAQDVISVSAIGQVNVLLETDTTEAGPLRSAVEEATSQALNAAAITATNAAGPDTPDAIPGMPANWLVSRIEGDVTVFNHLEQHNFVLDNDNVQIELASQRSEVILGENNAVNVASIAAIGFAYDLIVVAGNMVELSMINQVNVLLDHDHVSYGPTPGLTVDTGDNLAINLAQISDTGIDSYTDLDGPLDDTHDALSSGHIFLPGMLNHLHPFDDMALVRVLHIEGDFVTVSAIEQRNVLGDSDQVQMLLDDFVNEAEGDLTVTTGSNALMNLATIANVGMDSEVHVGGEVYSDALLYQAELIDASAAPTGVEIPGLANEAVAFLAEGLIDDDSPHQDELMIDPMMDGGPSPDVLTTVLA